MIIDHRYEVIESLGSGTWSNVFKVCDKRTGSIYALKLFQYLSSTDLYERFSAEEMHHIIRIEHPNLARIVDFGHVGDHIYCVSEYFDGFSLRQFKYNRGQVEVLYDMLVQILYALDALHCQDILHKDLKPENILYRVDSNKVQVKVIDYGFVKIDQSKEMHIVSGTLPYIAPETYASKLFSPASDFYSLGVLLYRVVTGSFPFSLEQINSYITGSHTYFIPKFPSEINTEISQSLEKLILRLLDRNPNNRFESAEEIINHINKIQDKQYPFSLELTIVNKLKFNSYISRSDYCHQVLDYVESVTASNGKVVSLIGGEGLGKDDVLSLFRFHLLNNKFFLFDYICSKSDHEPFFALIKEFMVSISKEELDKIDKLTTISEKFKLYLFQSVKDAKQVSQKPNELKSDYESVKNLLVSLSDQKPIIFIIRNAQHVHRYTIDFINYISPFIHSHKILILLGFNDYHKATQINHSIMIQLQALSYNESNNYLEKLLAMYPPEALTKTIWELSAGNPWFIREILIDWIQKMGNIKKDLNILSKFDEKYTLPAKVLNSINSRINKITVINHNHLVKLSILDFPFSKKVINYVLNINEKSLYEFIKDAVYSDILIKERQNYRFVYKEAKSKLESEATTELRIQISKSVIDFFKKIRIDDVEICKGLIRNSEVAKDNQAKRIYTLRLFEIYEEHLDQDAAYSAIIKIIEIDFIEKTNVPLNALISDIMFLQQKIELTGYSNISDDLLNKISRLPDLFEKYYLLGTVHFIRDEIVKAKSNFDTASEHIITGKQSILLWLYYCQYYAQNDLLHMKKYLKLLAANELPLNLKIAYIDRLTVYYKSNNELLIAIQTAEDFINELPSVQETDVLLKLASLNNNLGVCYSLYKNIDEANTHFNIALTIWKKFNVNRYLGLIYNNIADLYLKQGITTNALKYLIEGKKIAEEKGLKSTIALTSLNLAECYIKTGGFLVAEEYLYKAKEIMDSLKSTKFSASIIENLALAKSKIKSFSYYHEFIIHTEPSLLNGIIKEINPLVKAYFYYLFELGLSKKLSKLISKNAHINYHDFHEDEFYYNTLSLVSILNKEYLQALELIHSASKFAGEVKNHYALTVFYLMEVECYIGINDYSKASVIANKAKELSIKYNYNYWNCKLQLFQMIIQLEDSGAPLRLILRLLMGLYNDAEIQAYYIIKFKIMSIIIQVLNEMNAECEASIWLDKYKTNLKEITDGIDKDDSLQFLKNNYYHCASCKDVKSIKILPRHKSAKANWNELQYNLLNVYNSDRIKFLIEKGIKDLIAPWKFQINVFSEVLNSYSVFIADNSNSEYIYDPDVFKAVERAFKTDSIATLATVDSNTLIVPLQIKHHKIGFMVISDNNEASFTNFEISLIKAIKLHIINLIIRIKNYSEITYKMDMMNRLMLITHNILRIIDIRTLEQEILYSLIDFTGSSRGLLIKKDDLGNSYYQNAVDNNRTPITNISAICKTAISTCQNTIQQVYTYNAMNDKRFKNSISVQDYQLYTIYCAPLVVNDKIYGFIYLDNYLDNSKNMYLNSELITLLLDQINIALKNASQYKAIIDKSIEMQSLESLKDEFMAIVSHELNTPLTTLQGYVSRLKRGLFADEEEEQDIIGKIDANLKKLTLTTNDIINMNSYNLKKELSKVKVQISDLLEHVQREVEIMSRKRNMAVKLDVSKDLPEIDGNWEAIHQMVYNIVLNAIRFTSDFGTIIIGARLSAFQQERIDNNKSLVIYIQDNGIGIPDYQLNNIFRKFYELNEIYAHKSGTIEYRSSGLGLGLSTAKRIADLHKGKIWIKSKENEGTTVFISLPLGYK
jgi:signal transduction histidine kinase/serine/threonine protein kinase